MKLNNRYSTIKLPSMMKKNSFSDIFARNVSQKMKTVNWEI